MQVEPTTSPPAEAPADPPIASAKPAVNSAATTGNRSEPSEGGRAALQRPSAPEPSVRHMAHVEERPVVARTGSGANRNANGSSVTKVGLQVISLTKVQKLPL